MAKRVLIAKELLEKYEHGTCTEEEAALVEHWYESSHQEDFDLPESVLTEEVDRAWSVIESRKQVKPKIRLWRTIAIAGSLLLISGIAWYFYEAHQGHRQGPTDIVTDVNPGGDKATLQLASGKIIELDERADGTISSEAGVKITKTADGQLVYEIASEVHKDPGASGFNTITTPKGGQYQVNLPDGSKVWLNAASTLTYATSLRERGADKRRVILGGEAYFEIAKDKKHPFIVSTSGQEIQVLGTHFNVNSYADENVTTTTLEEGSVQISGNGKRVVIKPGEQALFDGKALDIQQANLKTVLAWKEGRIYFKDADIESIMRQVSRWYDIEVVYKGKVPEGSFNGGVSRKAKLSELLKILEASDMHFTLEYNGDQKRLVILP